VRFGQDEALATITLDSPPLNLIGPALIDDLLGAISEVEAAEGVRALVLRGAGNGFSAGADVALFSGMDADDMRPVIASFLDLGRRIEELPFPTLAVVHGTCMAGGLELALFCDLIWAAESTMLGLPETRLGIVPLAGGVERVAARAGLGRARMIALGGGLFPASDFAAWGIVDRDLHEDELEGAVTKFARQLAEGPTLAYAVVKDLLRAYGADGVPVRMRFCSTGQEDSSTPKTRVAVSRAFRRRGRATAPPSRAADTARSPANRRRCCGEASGSSRCERG